MLDWLRRLIDPHEVALKGRWCPLHCGARFHSRDSWLLHIGLAHSQRAHAMIYLNEGGGHSYPVEEARQ